MVEHAFLAIALAVSLLMLGYHWFSARGRIRELERWVEYHSDEAAFWKQMACDVVEATKRKGWSNAE